MPGVAQGGSTGTMCTCVPRQDSCPMQQRRVSQLSGTRHLMFFYPCQSPCQDLHVWKPDNNSLMRHQSIIILVSV